MSDYTSTSYNDPSLYRQIALHNHWRVMVTVVFNPYPGITNAAYFSTNHSL
ncbi:MAG: hypothetical protein ACXABZ_12980 [Candidatus Thorarchaeota archaeon]